MLGDSHTAAEWFFIIVSLVVAGFGIWLGFLFYIWRPHLPGMWARRLRAALPRELQQVLGGRAVRRALHAADDGRGARRLRDDSRVIDGAVNGVAWLTRQLSRFTGNTDKYWSWTERSTASRASSSF